MNEPTKRLAPTPQTLRELFLKSGNLCAFPGCTAIMMDADGTFVGQICHIEAAEPGGERFNPSMTNEDRRAAPNLILMCYQHHRITNDVLRYDVEGLSRIKTVHELRFSGPNRSLHERVAKAKWSTLIGTGALGGAAFSDIVRAFKHLLSVNRAEPSTGVSSVPAREDLVRRLRLAPAGVVHFYSRDPLHSAIGDQLLSIFQAAGWVLEQINDPGLPESQDVDCQEAMLLVFEISRAAQLSNAQHAIQAFFDECGFSISKTDESAERVESGHRLRFYITVRARSQ